MWSKFEVKLEEKFKKVQNQSLLKLKEPTLSEAPMIESNTLAVRIPTDTSHQTVISPIGGLSNGHTFAYQHVLSADMFSKEQLNDLFNLAQTFRVDVMKQRPLDHILAVIFSLYYFTNVTSLLLKVFKNNSFKKF